MLEKKMKRITDEDIIKHSLSSKEFTNLNIRLLDSDTRIEEGDRFEVIFRGIKEEIPKVELVGNTMNVEQNIDESEDYIYKLNHRYDLGVEITVPKGTELDKVNITSLDGDIKLRKLNVNNLYIKSGDGDINVEDSTIHAGEIFALDGDFKSDNSDLISVAIQIDDGDADMKRMNLDSGSMNIIDGNFKLWDSHLNGKYYVRNSEGDNEVEGVKNDDYGYVLDTLDGDNVLFDQSRQGHLETNTRAKNIMYMKTMDGNNIVK